MSDRRVFVVGSLNADHRVRVTRIPSGGETVLGSDITVSPGGKGANQAVAAARAGAAVTIVGAVGADRDGELLRHELAEDGIDIRHVHVTSGAATGRASVTVDDDGENSIVVSPGANSALAPEDVDAGLHGMREGDLLLLQLETPMPLVHYAARRASGLGGTVIVNAAPVSHAVTDLFDSTDVLIVNEHELTGIVDLLGGRAESTEDRRAAEMALVSKAADVSVVCTAGADGAFLFHDGRLRHVAATRAPAVDTTAAGDTFIGFLAAGMVEGVADIPGAIELAVRAAGVAVTRPGAIDSIPRMHEITGAASRPGKELSQ